MWGILSLVYHNLSSSDERLDGLTDGRPRTQQPPHATGEQTPSTTTFSSSRHQVSPRSFQHIHSPYIGNMVADLTRGMSQNVRFRRGGMSRAKFAGHIDRSRRRLEPLFFRRLFRPLDHLRSLPNPHILSRRVSFYQFHWAPRRSDTIFAELSSRRLPATRVAGSRHTRPPTHRPSTAVVRDRPSTRFEIYFKVHFPMHHHF